MKKFFILFVSILLLSGCSVSDSVESGPNSSLDVGSQFINTTSSNYTSGFKDNSNRVTELNPQDGYYVYSDSNPEILIIDENQVVTTSDNDTSTFSIDVDTASYSVFRMYVNNDNLPPEAYVRTEEMVNYFDYDYPQPLLDIPFGIETVFAPCPWNSETQLLMIGIQGKEIEYEEAPANNLVLLIDVSGSMFNELDMVKESFKLLINSMRENDVISIVTYASNATIVLEPTTGSNKDEILEALDSIHCGGGTNGSGGIELAYDLAYETFIFDGNNRVLLATDGDFNIGTTSSAGLIEIVTEKAEIGIYLTVLGFGANYFQTTKMEDLSNHGDGNYYFIDTLSEANKVLNVDIASTIVPIANDVKVQIEFDGNVVESYRLIGYENRVLSNEDFDNDDVDAGELGAGHNVTAFYEVTLKDEYIGNDVATISLRYKDIGQDESKLITGMVRTSDLNINPSGDFLFASAIIEVSLCMRDSDYKASSSYNNAIIRIESNLGDDPFGFRQEFLDLVNKLKNID